MKLRLVASVCTLGAAFAVYGSAPAAATNQFIGKPAPNQSVSLFVKLPLRNEAELEALSDVQSTPSSPQYRHFLSVAQFRARYAAAPATVAQVVKALGASGLRVNAIHSQLIVASAPATVVERALGVHLGLAHNRDGLVRVAADAAPVVPRALAALNVSIVGLSGTTAAKPQSRRVPSNRYSRTGGYWFDDLKQAYSYPAYTPFNGKGVRIAVVGESDFSDSDAKLYFNHERLGGPSALGPIPKIERLNLGGLPFDPNTGISDEANIDIQQAGGSAPGATIIGVDIPSAGEGFLYGYSVIDEYNIADIVSTSYGACELFETAAYNHGVDYTYVLRAYHQMFLQGNVQGITFMFSSGDDSGRPCPDPAYFGPATGKTYQDLPGTSIWSSDPNATSVGGTNLVTQHVPGSLTSKYGYETEFRDPISNFDAYGTGNFLANAGWGSGGGPSVVFAKPAYQYLIDTGKSTMRTDPDISMQMGGCPGYPPPIVVHCGPDDSYGTAYVGGKLLGFIGTSLSSPEFAGLLAVFEQAQGGVRLGNANRLIYSLAASNMVGGQQVYHDGIGGYNGVVYVQPGQKGYNQITGVGSPIGRDFVLLPLSPLAGDPQTPSNP